MISEPDLLFVRFITKHAESKFSLIIFQRKRNLVSLLRRSSFYNRAQILTTCFIYYNFNLFELLISKWKVTRRPKTTNKKQVIHVKTHVLAYVTYVYVQQKTFEI